MSGASGNIRLRKKRKPATPAPAIAKRARTPISNGSNGKPPPCCVVGGVGVPVPPPFPVDGFVGTAVGV